MINPDNNNNIAPSITILCPNLKEKVSVDNLTLVYICYYTLLLLNCKLILKQQRNIKKLSQKWLQWLSRLIHNPVFLGFNPDGGKVDSRIEYCASLSHLCG